MCAKPDFPSLRGNQFFDYLWGLCGEASISTVVSRPAPRSRASYLQAMAKDELWEEHHHMVRKHFTRNQFDVLPERSGQGSQACAIFVATVIAMFWDGRLPEFPLVFDETFWLGVLAKAVEGGDQFGHIRGSNVFEAVTMACWAVAN